MARKRRQRRNPGVTMKDLTDARDGLGLTDEHARELMDAIKDASTAREAHDVIKLADEFVNEEGEYASFGVESVEAPGERYADYLNTGDTYNITLLYDNEEREWSVTSWGDWMEKVQQEYHEEVGFYWLIPYRVEVEGSVPSVMVAIVQAPKKAEALEHFVEYGVAMGDDTVWDNQLDELGGVTPEQSDGTWYAVGTDPDVEDPDDPDATLTVYLTIGKPEPHDSLEDAEYAAGGHNKVSYLHQED